MWKIKLIFTCKTIISSLVFIVLLFIQFSVHSQETDTVQNLYVWELEDGYRINKISFDTIINQFHILNPIEKVSFSNTFLGSVGSEYRSNIFFDELDKPFTDFLPENAFAAYLRSKHTEKFYFSKKSYVELKYSMSVKKFNENNLDVIYTQNINKKWNVGMNYDLISADGIFPKNKVSEHSLNFFTSYTGDIYSMHAAYTRNKFRVQESGGIKPTSETDPSMTDPQISGASSTLFKSSFFVSQEFKLGKTVTEIIDDTLKQSTYKERGRINYVFNYENNYRNYLDDSENEFYADTIISSLWELDSLNLKLYENSLFWTFREMDLGNARLVNSLGLKYEIIKNHAFKGYVYVYDADYYKSLSTNFNSSGEFRKFRYYFNAFYYLRGYKINDYKGKFGVEKDFSLKRNISTIKLNVELSKRNPSLMEQYYYSNRFYWDNKFSKKSTAKVRLGFSIPKRKFKVELALAKLDNYIYFNALGYPAQLNASLNVLSARGEKEFKLGVLHSLNRLLWQSADNETAVSIPEVVLYHNLYLNLHYKTALYVHVGYELSYSTEFDALSYMPATGQFYQKREMKTGDFPIINVFADLRIQTVLLFLKFENIGSQFLRNDFYYVANNYPINPLMFKFGVSWRFKN